MKMLTNSNINTLSYKILKYFHSYMTQHKTKSVKILKTKLFLYIHSDKV